MKITAFKQHLAEVPAINFRLANGGYLPAHFHVTEVGLVTRHYIDCGGTERKEAYASFQLWEATDYDHRLTPQKLLHIIGISGRVLGSDDVEVDVEYQQHSISRFGLEFDGKDFVLVPRHTACLAQDACGTGDKARVPLSGLTDSASSYCASGSC